MSSSTGINTHRVLNTGCGLTPDERAAIEAAMVEQSSVDFGVFESDMDPPALYAEAAKLQQKHREAVIVIDYVQNVAPFGEFVDQYPRINESMRIFAKIARSLGFLVVIVSQVSKQAGKMNEHPSISDGLGSSSIEQASDVITSIWRPHQREPRPAPSQSTSHAWAGDAITDAWAARQLRCRVATLKNKYGPCGHVDLAFVGSRMQFRTATDADMIYWPALKGEAQ